MEVQATSDGIKQIDSTKEEVDDKPPASSDSIAWDHLKSEDRIKLGRILSKLGYTPAGKDSLMRFQTAKGLTATGAVDSKTMDAINKAQQTINRIEDSISRMPPLNAQSSFKPQRSLSTSSSRRVSNQAPRSSVEQQPSSLSSTQSLLAPTRTLQSQRLPTINQKGEIEYVDLITPSNGDPNSISLGRALCSMYSLGEKLNYEPQLAIRKVDQGLLVDIDAETFFYIGQYVNHCGKLTLNIPFPYGKPVSPIIRLSRYYELKDMMGNNNNIRLFFKTESY